MQQDLRLTDALVDFIEGGNSIVLASGGADRFPAAGRGVGCRVSADRRRVTILVPAAANALLLTAIADSGTCAVTVSEPTTHRSAQLKGTDAAVGPVEGEAGPILDHHTAGFMEQLSRIGYTERFTRALTWADPAELVAVTFTPSALFDQTPGPGAGNPLPARPGAP